ncbi:MAG: hypothetical protein ABI596_14675, partial [Pyrinomonadaceae bacterium]
MSQHLFTNSSARPTRCAIAATLAFCIALLALSLSHQSMPAAPGPVAGLNAAYKNGEQIGAPKQIAGEEARKYLEQTGEGQSLMQAVTAARFGLKWQERGPLGETGSGYLGLSHDQNLNAWFSEDGVTVRPTVSEQERDRSWQMGMRLKAYGYGNQLVAAPPIVSHHVEGNRIEYERGHCRLSIANCRFENIAITKSAVGTQQSPTGTLAQGRSSREFFQSAIGNRQSAITEWYENRGEGIEQGFTIEARPERNEDVPATEPLRLVVALAGSLRARVDETGQTAELFDERGEGVASYSKLVAVDVDGKQLVARMETNATGDEIALVVEDADAHYPIVIDPIVA